LHVEEGKIVQRLASLPLYREAGDKQQCGFRPGPAFPMTVLADFSPDVFREPFST
jgi:hypothetical protein